MSEQVINRPSFLFDSYCNRQEGRFRPCLATLRELILSIAPNAEETFSYQAHCFKHIYMLAGIGVTKEYCSLYTMSPLLIKKIKDDLKGYKTAGATIHFKPAEPLPEAIIIKIILIRLQENEALAMSRKKIK